MAKRKKSIISLLADLLILRKVERIAGPLPVTFIFPPSSFIPPGKQQLKGCQLLGVEMLFLFPVQFQVGLVSEDRFDELLQNVTKHLRLSVNQNCAQSASKHLVLLVNVKSKGRN